jgi:cyclic pyranopterin monophosphate synthase
VKYAVPAMADVRMVDVGPKPETERAATARAVVRTTTEVAARIAAGTIPKGDVLATARIAGIMAAKNTPQILPLCHPLLLTNVVVDLAVDAAAGTVSVRASAETRHRTGVEMEALCAAAAAALCVHDMCKALDPAMVIDDLCLEEKSGGKSGRWRRPG